MKQYVELLHRPEHGRIVQNLTQRGAIQDALDTLERRRAVPEGCVITMVIDVEGDGNPALRVKFLEPDFCPNCTVDALLGRQVEHHLCLRRGEEVAVCHCMYRAIVPQ